LVLSALVGWLLPLALASFLASLGVCVLAAVQARLSPHKDRFWSRPLVGLLFALQPVVRGWARYRGRLFAPRTSLARYESFDSQSLKQARHAPCEVGFEDPSGLGRERFLGALLEHLAATGWQLRVDSGWGTCDAEVYGSRWSKLQLLTVNEHTPEGRRRIRCRLRTRTTLAARIGLGMGTGAALVAVALAREAGIWSAWPLLLPVAALAWLRLDQRNLRRVFAAVLDALVRKSGWQAQGPSPPAPGNGAMLPGP
jgi:hypothetical protein